MCASVVKLNLCNRLWILVYSLSPNCLFPRNAEALLARKTRELLKILPALNPLAHLSGGMGSKRDCSSLLPFALLRGIVSYLI